jgi:hypothetical protein
MNLGEYDQASLFFDTSLLNAELLGRGANLQVLQTTKALYASTYGIDPTPVETLSNILDSNHFHDAYTRAQINLETVRNLNLLGRTKEAFDLLKRCRKKCYELKNYRMELLFQLRLAEIYYLQNNIPLCSQVVQGALDQIGKFSNDIWYEIAFLGMKIKILGNAVEVKDSWDRLQLLTNKSHGILPCRILSRYCESVNRTQIFQEKDPLGDLIDRAWVGGVTAVDDVIRSGYLGLLPRALGYQNYPEVLWLRELQYLGYFDRGNIFVTRWADDLTLMQQSFILNIFSGVRDLADLTRNVWREKYQQQRHRVLIQKMMIRLEEKLGNSRIFQLREHDVLIRPTMILAFEGSDSSPPLPMARAAKINWSEDLNHRQISLLLAANSSQRLLVDVKQYRIQHSVSSRTATRDLGILVEKGYASVVGRGKASHYVVCPK